MEYNQGPSHRRFILGALYFTGCLVVSFGSHLQTRSADPSKWKSFVSKYGKDYPSLNNKWTVDGFVGSRSKNSFKNIETEFSKLKVDAGLLSDMMDKLDSDTTSTIITINKIDEYLDRWKAVMYLLQTVYDTDSNGDLPVETMRKTAGGQMKALFTDASHELPGLLTRIDSQIRNSDSSSGSCLLCKFVARTIMAMNSSADDSIDLKTAVNESEEFLSQLMKLQVRGALLYDMTCSPEDIPCRQKIVTLERALQLQSQKLRNCTPMLMTKLSQQDVVDNLYFVNLLSSEIMYIPDSDTLSSRKKKLNLNDALVRGCAMKCAERSFSVKDQSLWKIETAPDGYYYVRGKNDCYVGFDRSFLSFINTGLDNTEAAGAEKDEVLLCRPDPVPHRKTVTFKIEPVSANHTSAYKLRNVLTGKYLRSITTKEYLTDDKTGGHVINLVLQKCDNNQLGCTWGITTDVPECQGCLVISFGSHLHTRSADPSKWKSFVSKYGKDYPSLNNKWTVDGFVGSRRNDSSFKNIETEFSKLNIDADLLSDMMDKLDSDTTSTIITINKIDEYLDRWKAVMYLLQTVYDTNSNGDLPVETMRKTAGGQMKALFEDASHELPGLLTRIDSQIRDTDSSSGVCLLCKFVAQTIIAMNSSADDSIDLKTAVNESEEFLSQLMKLQVRGALLYDMTCSPEDIPCRQKIVTLERALQSQSQKLRNCTPMLMTKLSQQDVVDNLYFVNLFSSEIMYIPDSDTLSSRKKKLNLNNAIVRGCAMKCAERSFSVKDQSLWKIETAPDGYYVRGKNDCYVGFDRSFLSFINTGLDNPEAAGAENDEVLLCRPDPVPNRKTQTFKIEPVSANHTSAYKLRNVLTGKYLRSVRTKEYLTDDKTGGHVINLVLQKCDNNQLGCTWGITTDVPECQVRKTNTFLDMFILKLYLLLMGVLFIMLVASLVLIWLYRKQIRRDYLQYRRVNTQEVIIPPSYRFPSRT